ncbi:uncharacterized protein BCR38DRAFT_505895 [Pseudomassariella vexata]|uniref:Uncharacterized protein n=1 Tax=Pseudomassariella vexata TaxID=1141098 RepID=A0A1Y2D8R9_9PEZI|nr:uncharacterized protein BCR38DRAFT_505895 [Pseudomassariella vexata]ORY55663.1 hypothetical protein BCR38DRAFT_505895 [Pseudomassariella vexata]
MAVEGWPKVFDLINDISGALVQEQWDNELLCIAAGFGCIPIMQRLLDTAVANPALKRELLLRDTLPAPVPMSTSGSARPPPSTTQTAKGNTVFQKAAADPAFRRCALVRQSDETPLGHFIFASSTNPDGLLNRRP